MVGIIDYGMGNLASVQKAFSKIGITSFISRDIKKLKSSKALVLPGVGSFYQGMENLKKYNLVDFLNSEVITNKKPFLGICLGMQLIMEEGNEPIKCLGLGWIKGSVELLNNKKLPVPHLGWNNIYGSSKSRLFDKLENNFYFIHSYYVKPNEPLKLQWVNYEHPIVASFEKENILATQFHPEKSQKAGLDLLENFFTKNVEN